MDHHPTPPLPRSPQLSTLTSPTEPNLLMQWLDPIIIAIFVLIRYIQSTPLIPRTRLTSLHWCKDRRGVRHEFLLVEVERPQSNMWIRLDRRVHKDSAWIDMFSSTSPSADSATLCSDLKHLLDESRSEIIVSTTFQVPPPLQSLGTLLSIVIEESAGYKPLSENCFFLCAVIYEVLFDIGKGVNTYGAPTTFFESLTRSVRAKIKRRVNTLLEREAVGSPSSRANITPSITADPFLARLMNLLHVKWPRFLRRRRVQSQPSSAIAPHLLRIMQNPSNPPEPTTLYPQNRSRGTSRASGSTPRPVPVIIAVDNHVPGPSATSSGPSSVALSPNLRLPDPYTEIHSSSHGYYLEGQLGIGSGLGLILGAEAHAFVYDRPSHSTEHPSHAATNDLCPQTSQYLQRASLEIREMHPDRNPYSSACEG